MTDKILSFSDWERANKVYEDVHPKVFAALRGAPTKLHQGVSNAKNALGDESGLTGHGAQGSSRGVYQTTKGHEIDLDGKKTKVNTILKTTLQRKSSVPGKQTGQRQNEVEASNHIQKFATIVRDGKGGYKSNPDGVLPPVYEIGKKSKWLHSGTARDLEPGEFRELTKHDSHPDGIESYHLSSWTSHGSGENHEHPIVRKFAKFRKETGIGDFHDGNFGVWEHPHTGERHLVLRDAGFDNNVKKDYGFHCLGLTAGGNRYDSALASKVLTTHFIAAHPHHAARMIDHEIGLHAKKAERMGMKPGVRMNITSDIAWEHHAPKMFQKHSNVQFYDYTKMPNRVLRSLAPKKSEADFHNSMGHPSNYHLTLSHTGSGHEESNDKDVIKVLDKGGSVASVFQRGKAAGGLPTHIEDVKTGKRYPVKQGDKDDNTFDRPNAVSGLMLKGVKNHEVGKFANKVDADRIARINHD